MTPKQIWKSQKLRKSRNSLYEIKRFDFELQWHGLFRKNRTWSIAVVYRIADTAAVGGGGFTETQRTISLDFRHPYSALRWLTENVQNEEDLEFYGVDF
jgi:hypothetical protein